MIVNKNMTEYHSVCPVCALRALNAFLSIKTTPEHFHLLH